MILCMALSGCGKKNTNMEDVIRSNTIIGRTFKTRKYAKWGSRGKDIRFYFRPYALACFAAGFQEVTILYDEFEIKILRWLWLKKWMFGLSGRILWGSGTRKMKRVQEIKLFLQDEKNFLIKKNEENDIC